MCISELFGLQVYDAWDCAMLWFLLVADFCLVGIFTLSILENIKERKNYKKCWKR